MSKKRKRTNYNNIDELHVDIDYGKLAAAIAEGNETRNKQYSVSREWMKVIIQLLLFGIELFGGITCIVCLIYGVKVLGTLVPSGTTLEWANIARAFTAIMVGFFLLALCMVTIVMSKEIDKENDKQYIASLFSNITTLIALIIAIIALLIK